MHHKFVIHNNIFQSCVETENKMSCTMTLHIATTECLARGLLTKPLRRNVQNINLLMFLILSFFSGYNFLKH